MPLFVVATPVGNLEDITRRAVRVLGEVELVLAEDTRATRVLLDAIGVSTPMRSYHDHSDARVVSAIVERLKAGAHIGLVSDAGTPCVSDPGYALVRAAIDAGVLVIPIPGASSVLAFVSVAGLPTDRFQFVGFAPRKDGARTDACADWAGYPGTTVVLESPNRIVDLLTRLAEVAPERAVVVGRELTKLHEEFVRGSAVAVLAELGSRDRVRGEVVLGIGPAPAVAAADAEVDAWTAELVGLGLRTKDVARVVARRLGRSVDEVYRRALELREGED